MDDRGNLYENPTDEEIARLNLVRLPELRDRFAEIERTTQTNPAGAERVQPLSRRERRARDRKLAKGRI